MLCIAEPCGTGACPFAWPFGVCGAACCCCISTPRELAIGSGRDVFSNRVCGMLVASIKLQTSARSATHPNGPLDEPLCFNAILIFSGYRPAPQNLPLQTLPMEERSQPPSPSLGIFATTQESSWVVALFTLRILGGFEPLKYWFCGSHTGSQPKICTVTPEPPVIETTFARTKLARTPVATLARNQDGLALLNQKVKHEGRTARCIHANTALQARLRVLDKYRKDESKEGVALTALYTPRG